jgi:hypothetical protein
MLTPILILALAASGAHAHTAAWAKGMYCLNGTEPGVDNQNNDAPIGPLYDMDTSDWWFQHDRGCDAFPPDEGDFLHLPAGGQFTVELAHNRAFTTLSYDGTNMSDWPDGQDHPDTWAAVAGQECVSDGAMHTTNHSQAGGTAFAISYHDSLEDVTMENLVVFTTRKHTPWKRLTAYDVPEAMPACPPGGCTCAWLWIPNGCGQPNMYMQGFKCKVTGAVSQVPLAAAQPPVYCENRPNKCVRGAKQMLAWHQKTGNNIHPPHDWTPNYNEKCGFKNGAQEDIFDTADGTVKLPKKSGSKKHGSKSCGAGKMKRFHA